MKKLDLPAMYAQHARHALASHAERPLEWAVGGEFEAFGRVQVAMLRYYGLPADGYLIDVGCGSGRTAKPLAEYLRGRYLGLDVVPEFLEHARAAAARPPATPKRTWCASSRCSRTCCTSRAISTCAKRAAC
jgi:SAM-dependent methyltransferase